MADDDPLISAEELIAAPGARTRFVDATWFMPDAGRNAKAEYLERHLPGAVFFDIDAVADRTSPLPHMLPSSQAFGEAVGRMGISPQDEVVVYDRAPTPSAPRVWWTFRAMGHSRVRVLDGGLEAWAADGDLESGPVSTPPVVYAALRRPELVRDFEQVRWALRQGGVQVVDARPSPRFLGQAPEPRPGLRSGHMPGALNVPAGTFYDPDGRMRSPANIRSALEAAQVNLSKPVIATCGSGITAAVIAFGLARVGRDDAAVYDGSWAEWGGRDEAPVASSP